MPKIDRPLWTDIAPNKDVPITDDDLLSFPQTSKTTHTSKSEIDRQVAAKTFPPPIVISERIRRWRKSHLEAYLQHYAKMSQAA